MSKWKTTTFQSAIDIGKGDYITKKEAKPGPYPVILGGKEPAYYIDRFNHTGRAIVVSRSGASAGFVSRWDEPIFVTDGFIVDPKDGIDFEFIYYALKNSEGILQGRQSGAAIPHVTPKLIYGLRLRLPEIEKQQKIASLLSAYDDLIETNQRQIKLLEEAAQRLYKEWFVDLRFPGHENVPVVDGVPEGWTKKKVTDLLQIRYGKDHKSLEDGDIPVYGSGGIMRKVKPILYSGESVLIPRKGSLNNILFVDGDFWTIDTMFYSIPQMGNVAKYCYLFLSRLDMYSFNIGAAVPSMTVNILDGIDILLPTKQIMAAFEEQIRVLFDQKKLLAKQNDVASEARDRLLPKLMSGEIAI